MKRGQIAEESCTEVFVRTEAIPTPNRSHEPEPMAITPPIRSDA